MTGVFSSLFSLFPMQLPLLKRQGGILLLSIMLPLIALNGFAQSQPAEQSIVSADVVEQKLETTAAVTSIAKSSTAASASIANNNLAQSSTNGAAPIGSGRHLMNVTLALIGIVGLIFALSWFVKRFNQGTFSANAHVKILSVMPLGTRERIVLIDAGGQQILLGITSANINTLHVFDTPIVVENNDQAPSDFSRKLMSILQQKTSPASMQSPNNKNNSAP